jgi:hypothetical protein
MPPPPGARPACRAGDEAALIELGLPLFACFRAATGVTGDRLSHPARGALTATIGGLSQAMSIPPFGRQTLTGDARMLLPDATLMTLSARWRRAMVPDDEGDYEDTTPARFLNCQSS